MKRKHCTHMRAELLMSYQAPALKNDFPLFLLTLGIVHHAHPHLKEYEEERHSSLKGSVERRREDSPEPEILEDGGI